MIDSYTAYILFFAFLNALIIFAVVQNARRRPPGRVHRERTTFNTVYPRRK